MRDIIVRFLALFIFNRQRRHAFRDRFLSVTRRSCDDLNQFVWEMYVSGAEWQRIINTCKKNDIKKVWQYMSHDFWLIYICALWANGEETECRHVLTKYFRRHGSLDIERYILAAYAANHLGLRNRNIQKSVRIYDYIKEKGDFASLFNNKTVAVVGNSPNILETKTGTEIDSHDIVIRFNNFITDGFTECVGSKTDVWMRNTGSKKVMDRSSEQFKGIVWENDLLRFKILHNHLNILYRDICAGKHVCFIPHVCFNQIKNILHFNPSMGVLMIHYLVHFTHPKQIDIYGFSVCSQSTNIAAHYFKNTNEDLKSDSVWHNISNENDYLTNLLTKGQIK